MENVSYHKELVRLCDTLQLRAATATNLVSALSVPYDIAVLFLLSVPSSLKTTLLHAASLVIYTPKFEHFGIVPLEAMLARRPVLAAKSGGPTETVVDGRTGWLCDVEKPEEWTSVMESILLRMTAEDVERMGQEGRRRVLEHFSQSTMAKKLDAEIRSANQAKSRPRMVQPSLLLAGGCLISIALAALMVRSTAIP